MSAIPQEAALGFQRGAAAYERGRPGYPDAAIARLAGELDLGPTPYRTHITWCHAVATEA